MATFSNQSKKSTTFSNQNKSTLDLTIDEADIEIDNALGTIDNPSSQFSRQSKNTTSFSNQTKN